MFFTSSKRHDLISQPTAEQKQAEKNEVGGGLPEGGRVAVMEGTANREVADRVIRIMKNRHKNGDNVALMAWVFCVRPNKILNFHL